MWVLDDKHKSAKNNKKANEQIGDKAIVIPCGGKVGVILENNGSIDKVTALLYYCNLRDFIPFCGNGSGGRFIADGYALAHLCQVTNNAAGSESRIVFLEGNLEEEAKDRNCAIYCVDYWRVVQIIGAYRNSGHKLVDLLLEIDKSQPIAEQLGKESIIDAEKIRKMESITFLGVD